MASAGAGRRIVVAVDEGDESAHALSWCLANVVSPAGADTLVLLHARRPRPVYAAMDSAGYMLASDVMASVERHANAVSAAAVDKAKRICAAHPHVKVETLVESGDPRDVICDAAEKTGGPAGHGQPRIRLHPKGIPGQRQQALRAELQVPCPDCQEAQGVASPSDAAAQAM